MHEGHRQRMLERIRSDPKGLQDHELLEALLFNVIPRRNTNDIAHRLLDSFGSLEGVLRAGDGELMAIEGVGPSAAAYLKLVDRVFQRVKEGGQNEPLLFNYEGFVKLLGERFASLKEEILEIYCTDARDRVTVSRRFTSHNHNLVRIEPEEVSRFIVSIHPHTVVLAHNHLGASCEPSRADDEFTAQIQLLCSMHNICLGDHIIVDGNGEYFSYYISGRLERIKSNFNVASFLARTEI